MSNEDTIVSIPVAPDEVFTQDQKEPLLPGLSPVESQYMSTLPEDVQGLYLNDPEALRDAMLNERAAAITGGPGGLTISWQAARDQASDSLRDEETAAIKLREEQDIDSKRAADELLGGGFDELPLSAQQEQHLARAKTYEAQAKQLTMESERQMASTGITAVATDLLKAPIRGVLLAPLRFGDVIKRLTVGPLASLVDHVAGGGVFSPQTLKDLNTRLTPADEELLISIGDTIKVESPIGDFATEVASFAVGYGAASKVIQGASVLLPALVPVRAIDTVLALEAKRAALTSIPYIGKAASLLGAFLRASLTGDITASVVGPSSTMTELALHKLLGDKLTAKNFSQWYNTQPEVIQLGFRLLENTVMSIPFEALAMALKARGATTKTIGVLADTLDPVPRTPQVFSETIENHYKAQRAARQADLEAAFSDSSRLMKIQRRAKALSAPAEPPAPGVPPAVTESFTAQEWQEGRNRILKMQFEGRAFGSDMALAQTMQWVAPEFQRVADEAAATLQKTVASMEPAVQWGEGFAKYNATMHDVTLQAAEVSAKPVATKVAKEAQESIVKKVKPGKKTKAPAPEAPITPEAVQEEIKSIKVADISDELPKTEDTYKSQWAEARQATFNQTDGAFVKTNEGGFVTNSTLEGDIVRLVSENSDTPSIVKATGAPEELVEAVREQVEKINSSKARGPKGGVTKEDKNKIYDLWAETEEPFTIGSIMRSKEVPGASKSTYRSKKNSPLYGFILPLPSMQDIRRAGVFAQQMAEGVAHFAPKFAKSANGFFVTPGLMFAADVLGGDAVDFTFEDYLYGAAIGMGVNLVKGHLSSMGAVLPPSLKSTYDTMLSQGTLDITNIANTIVSPEFRGKFYGDFAESTLRGPVKKAERLFNKVLTKVLPPSGNTTNVYSHDFSQMRTEARLGTPKGVSSIVEPSVFYDPTILKTSIEDTFSVVEANISAGALGSALTDKTRATIGRRWLDFVANLGVTQQAVEYFERLGGTAATAEKRQAIMVTLDSYERFVMERLGKALNVAPKASQMTMAQKATVSEADAFLRTFRKLVSDPMQLFSAAPDNQALTAVFFKQIAEGDLSHIGGRAFDKFTTNITGMIPSLKGFIGADGTVPDAMRAQLYAFLIKTETEPSLTEVVGRGIYNCMLSSYHLVKNSMVSNTVITGLEATSTKVSKGLFWLWSDTAGMDIMQRKFNAMSTAIPAALTNTAETLRTGQKVLDRGGERVVYKNLSSENLVKGLGGNREAVPVFHRALERTTEIFGPTPITVTKTLDVGYQTILHAGELESSLWKEAYRLAEDGNISARVAYDQIVADPTRLAGHSEIAINRSRGALGISSTMEPHMVGGEVVHKATLAGRAVENLAVTQQHPVVRLAEPFFSTDAFAKLAAYRFDPVMQLLGDLGKGKEGFIYSRFNNWHSMTTSQKTTAKRELTEIGGRVITGTMFATSVLGVAAAAGYNYVSPMFSLNKDEKRLGASEASFTKDGKTISLKQASNVTHLLSMLAPIALYLNHPEPTEEQETLATKAALCLDYFVTQATPDSVIGLMKTLGNMAKNSEEDPIRLLTAGEDFMLSVMRRANPTAINQIRSFSNNVLLRAPRTIDEVFSPREAKNLLGDTTGIDPLAPIGYGTDLPTSELSKFLSQNGVDVSRPPLANYGGLRIDDIQLASDYQDEVSSYLKREGDSFLKYAKSWSTREDFERLAKEFVSSAKASAKSSLLERLDKFYTSKTGIPLGGNQ